MLENPEKSVVRSTRWLGRALVLAVIVGIVLGTVFLSSLDLGETTQALARVDLPTLSVVLFLSLVNYALRFWRWILFLGGRAAPVPFGRHLAIYLSGFALTATPGKAGETMRSLYLRPFGIPASRSLAAFYAERLLDLIVISLMAMLLVAHPSVIMRVLGLIGAAIALVLLAMQHPGITALVGRVGAGLPGRAGRVASMVADFLGEVRMMMTARLAAGGILLGLVAWGAEGLGTYLVLHSMGFPIDLSLAFGIYATAMVAGVLSFLPGGLGGTEIVMTSLLIHAGVSAPVAVAATIIVRLATLWFAVVIGLAAWVGLEAFGGLKRRNEVASR
ncbi:YbhN family protein [Pelagibacterium halotolerans]|uniref:lysylphosphatidylglycerol synthase transmembrane domain-containing protein n=1 Tax=Pelagibacterium halotolerans TaxID=531813 RepID=UPI00384F971B